VHGRDNAIWRAAADEIVDWLGFYNSRRLHTTRDYVSHATFEWNWFAAQGRAAQFPRLWDSSNRRKTSRRIGNIARPDLVRCGGSEVAFQQIWRNRQVVVRGYRCNVLALVAGSNAMLRHQLGNPLLAHANPNA
jgi:hypothetical protein